jgi:hypothetical protein
MPFFVLIGALKLVGAHINKYVLYFLCNLLARNASVRSLALHSVCTLQ